jgi:hypothetical protein
MRSIFLSVVAGIFLVAGCDTVTPAQFPVAKVQAELGRPLSVGSSALDATGGELRQVFSEWSTARKEGDVAGIESLYDTRHFEGIRIGKSGLEKRLSWSEWQAAQRPVLQASATHRPSAGAVQPAATEPSPVFESWAGTLDIATASVTFDDHGTPHVLLLGRGGDGKLRIVREEVGGIPRRDPSTNTLARDAKVQRALASSDEK